MQAGDLEVPDRGADGAERAGADREALGFGLVVVPLGHSFDWGNLLRSAEGKGGAAGGGEALAPGVPP